MATKAAGGKIYEIILCSYTGKAYAADEIFLHVGVKRQEDPLFCKFIENKIGKLEHIIKGKQSSEIDCGYELEITEKLKCMIDERTEK